MSNPGTMSRDEGIRKLREMIKGVEFCMMTTVDEQGHLHSRPMATNDADEFDGQLWFFTYGRSHKADEVSRNHQVNLSYADPKSQNYVSLSGLAHLVRDKDEIRRRWKPQYKAWFPNGTDEPDIALLRVDVEKAEYWDAPSSTVAHVMGLIQTQVLGRQPDTGENRQVSLQ